MFTNLLQLRKQKKLTQEDVAKACKVDRATVSKWESGEFFPRVDKLILISNLLECSVDELLKKKRSDKND